MLWHCVLLKKYASASRIFPFDTHKSPDSIWIPWTPQTYLAVSEKATVSHANRPLLWIFLVGTMHGRSIEKVESLALIVRSR